MNLEIKYRNWVSIIIKNVLFVSKILIQINQKVLKMFYFYQKFIIFLINILNLVVKHLMNSMKSSFKQKTIKTFLKIINELSQTKKFLKISMNWVLKNSDNDCNDFDINYTNESNNETIDEIINQNIQQNCW